MHSSICMIHCTTSTDCSPMVLWNLPAPGSRYLDDVHFLDYANCTNVQCVGLENATLMTVTVAAYNNTSPGSTVRFFTDKSNGYAPNITTSPERRCESDLTWSGDPIVSGRLRLYVNISILLVLYPRVHIKCYPSTGPEHSLRRW